MVRGLTSEKQNLNKKSTHLRYVHISAVALKGINRVQPKQTVKEMMDTLIMLISNISAYPGNLKQIAES